MIGLHTRTSVLIGIIWTALCVAGNIANAETLSSVVTGLTISVDATGAYAVQSKDPAWTIAGKLDSAPTDLAIGKASDPVGEYNEIGFNYESGGAKAAFVRL